MKFARKWTWTGSRNIWLALTAVVIGACAYALAHRYLRGQEAAVRERLTGQYASRDTLVAAHDLAAGSVLTPTVLARRGVPARFLASDAVDAGSAGEVLGRTITRALQAGEAVTSSSLEPVASAALSSLVEPGLRALTIPVDDSNASAGMLSPGDAVDLLLVTHGDDSKPGAPSVRPLLQAVRIVATGQRLHRPSPAAPDHGADDGREPATQYQTVTLHVRPEDAERILLAQRLGELAVLLRHEGDVEPASLPSIGPAAVLDTPLRRRARSQSRQVEFIVGGMGAATRARRAAP